MPSQKRVPKYRHYRPKNLAVVRLDGKDHYLGTYDSVESWEKYHALVADWLGGQRPQPSSRPTSELSINQVMLAYMKYAESYYVRDGQPTRETEGIRDSLRSLRKLFGSTPAEEFGPLRLKSIRQHMIEVQGLCRNEINKRIGRIKRMFSWAVSEELLPASISHALETVKGLKKGRSAARESKPVKPSADVHVDAVLPYLPPQVAAMINLQRLTGMRPGEVVIMRRGDIDTSHDVWVYEIPKHKTDWRGYEKFVAIGPRAQEVLRPFMERPAEAYLFAPREAFEWRLENRQICYKKDRKTPIYPSEQRAREKAKQARRKRKSQKALGQHYTTQSYWRALDYGFKKAEAAGVKLTHWHPHQLRHSRGTELRKKYGIEASKVSLGHASLKSTEIYAEKDFSLAIKIAKELG